MPDAMAMKSLLTVPLRGAPQRKRFAPGFSGSLFPLSPGLLAGGPLTLPPPPPPPQHPLEAGAAKGTPGGRDNGPPPRAPRALLLLRPPPARGVYL